LDLTFDESKIVNLPRSNNLKTIVFDLDETLVHCNESVSIPGDAILPITFPNGETV
jgi:CTD small phosphatase-like protein 2